ncbi:MAG: CBS domain-containing protein [Tepidiformaceae bacterium]
MSDLRSIDVPVTSQVDSDSALSEPIGDARLSKPTTIEATATVAVALDVLRRDPNGAVVVVDGARVTGIFTERDVLKSVAGRPEALSRPLTEFMTHDPVVLREDDSMAVALNKMGAGGFRHIPLLRDGKLVALVTANDVMSWVMDRFFAQTNG